MNKLLNIFYMFLLLILSLGINAEEFKNKKEYYYDQPVEIKGIKKTEQVPDDIKEVGTMTLHTINLSRPILIKPTKDQEDYEQIKIDKIELTNEKIVKQIPDNQCVILKSKGGFAYSFTVHIYTKAYMAVDSFKLCKE